MGYYVQTEKMKVVVPKENLETARERMCELNTHDEYKRGGDGQKRWFSWLDDNYTEAETAEEILNMVGYSTLQSETGLLITGYNDKTGCEDLFLWSISDLCEPQSFVEWQGEDGERWLWEFGGGLRVKQSNAKITYENPVEFVPYVWP